jgi:hypothetical protein
VDTIRRLLTKRNSRRALREGRKHQNMLGASSRRLTCPDGLNEKAVTKKRPKMVSHLFLRPQNDFERMGSIASEAGKWAAGRPSGPSVAEVRGVTRFPARRWLCIEACAVVNASPMFAAHQLGIRSPWKPLGAIDLRCVLRRWFVALLSQNAPSAKLSPLPYAFASRD